MASVEKFREQLREVLADMAAGARPGTGRDRPLLTPEEHAPRPLDPEERQRRAELLARVREANRTPRADW